MDSAFLNADNVAQSDGTTARLLNLDVQDESIGDQLLNLDAEKVDDADYLLKSMVMPEAQACICLDPCCLCISLSEIQFKRV